MNKTFGHTIPFLDEQVDGWQAYCAGMTLGANSCKRGTEAYQKWKEAFLEAKAADERGTLSNDVKELPTQQYFERHPDKKPNEKT